MAPVWFVQVRYPVSVPEEGRGRWITVLVTDDKAAAAKSSGVVYRNMEHPDDSFPTNVRLRSDEQLRREESDEAVAEAYRSFREFSETRAAAETDVSWIPQSLR
jgi:hypothetical protein